MPFDSIQVNSYIPYSSTVTCLIEISAVDPNIALPGPEVFFHNPIPTLGVTTSSAVKPHSLSFAVAKATGFWLNVTDTTDSLLQVPLTSVQVNYFCLLYT